MEVYDAMRTAFAARDYTDEPVADETLYRILDNARFAPSGGNRQGWRVIIVRDRVIRGRLRQMLAPTVRQYKAQALAGETPFCAVTETAVTREQIEQTPAGFPLVDGLEDVPVVLVVCVDLGLVTAFDKDLARVGVVAGASIYPFAWNLLLAARNEGLGGVLTTYLAHREEAARAILRLPDNYAIAALLGIGKPVKQLTRLRRNPVEHFTRVDTFDGARFEP